MLKNVFSSDIALKKEHLFKRFIPFTTELIKFQSKTPQRCLSYPFHTREKNYLHFICNNTHSNTSPTLKNVIHYSWKNTWTSLYLLFFSTHTTRLFLKNISTWHYIVSYTTWGGYRSLNSRTFMYKMIKYRFFFHPPTRHNIKGLNIWKKRRNAEAYIFCIRQIQ